MKKNMFWIWLAVFIVLVAGNIIVLVKGKMYEKELARTEEKTNKIRQQYFILSQQHSNASSLNHIASEAARIGFTKDANVKNITRTKLAETLSLLVRGN